jgi:RND family efflux transporter MFP subunit
MAADTADPRLSPPQYSAHDRHATVPPPAGPPLPPRLLATAICAAGLLAGCLPTTTAEPGATATTALASTPASEKAPATPVPVRRAVLQDGFESALTFTGRVEARRLSRLGFERAGLLAEVLVREGDAVSADDVLARLDRARLQARREELVAALASAEADLALAEATAERYRGAVQDGAVTRQALDEAVEGARAAAANVRLARARIATVDVDLGKSALLAPFDGVVTDRLTDEGQVLDAGTPVLSLQEAAAPEIRVGVAGRLTHRLEPGRIYELRVGDDTIRARLRTVLPRRAGTSRTVDALFDPATGEDWPRPGELAHLTLAEAVAEPGLWLPLSALTADERGLWRALVAVPADGAGHARGRDITARHRLEARPVQILELREDRAYVSGPIADTEPVVTGGLHRVVAGQLVRVTPAADAAPADGQVAAKPRPGARLARAGGRDAVGEVR